jgi:hypothetical protein
VHQCHVLPDPKRHTADEWPTVVARMQENMEWMNRVVGSQPVPGEPQLRIEEINAFLRSTPGADGGEPLRRRLFLLAAAASCRSRGRGDRALALAAEQKAQAERAGSR